MKQFYIYMIVAMLVFFAVLLFSVRKRASKPWIKLLLLTIILTFAGMIFARMTYGKGLPWWIYYGAPKILSYVIPPVVLKMSRSELLVYLPLALISAPVIHSSFSFFLDWHEYMPLFYVPFWREIIH